MAKGLSVEEMVRLDDESEFDVEEGFEAEMIQLKGAMALAGEVAYVTEGSHFQLAGLDVQLTETVSRKVVKVQEPTGNGWAPDDELWEGVAGEGLL